MKVLIDNIAEFAEIVSVVSKLAVENSSLEAAKNLSLRLDGDRLSVQGWSSETSLAVSMPASGDSGFWAAVPAKTLAEITSAIKANKASSQLTLSVEDTTLTLKTKQSKNIIRGIDPSEIPEIKLNSHPQIVLSGDLIGESLEIVRHLVSGKDEGRAYLTGVCITIGGETLSFAAADGFAAAERTIYLKESVPNSYRLIVPSKHIKLLIDLSKGESLSLTFGESSMIFQGENFVAWFNTLDGDFPDIRSLVPQSGNNDCTVDVGELMGAIKLVKIFGRESNNSTRFEISPSEAGGEMTLRPKASERGENEAKIACQTNGETHFSLNSEIVENCIRTSKEVVFVSNGPVKPVKILDADDPSRVFVIMPMYQGA